MERRALKKRAWLVVLLAIGGLLAGLAAKAGSFLIVDEPRRSDVILVLAGETAVSESPSPATTMSVAGLPPKDTVEPGTNPVPVMVTAPLPLSWFQNS